MEENLEDIVVDDYNAPPYVDEIEISENIYWGEYITETKEEEANTKPKYETNQEQAKMINYEENKTEKIDKTIQEKAKMTNYEENIMLLQHEINEEVAKMSNCDTPDLNTNAMTKQFLLKIFKKCTRKFAIPITDFVEVATQFIKTETTAACVNGGSNHDVALKSVNLIEHFAEDLKKSIMDISSKMENANQHFIDLKNCEEDVIINENRKIFLQNCSTCSQSSTKDLNKHEESAQEEEPLEHTKETNTAKDERELNQNVTEMAEGSLIKEECDDHKIFEKAKKPTLNDNQDTSKQDTNEIRKQQIKKETESEIYYLEEKEKKNSNDVEENKNHNVKLIIPPINDEQVLEKEELQLERPINHDLNRDITEMTEGYLIKEECDDKNEKQNSNDVVENDNHNVKLIIPPINDEQVLEKEKLQCLERPINHDLNQDVTKMVEMSLIKKECEDHKDFEEAIIPTLNDNQGIPNQDTNQIKKENIDDDLISFTETEIYYPEEKEEEKKSNDVVENENHDEGVVKLIIPQIYDKQGVEKPIKSEIKDKQVSKKRTKPAISPDREVGNKKLKNETNQDISGITTPRHQKDIEKSSIKYNTQETTAKNSSENVLSASPLSKCQRTSVIKKICCPTLIDRPKEPINTSHAFGNNCNRAEDQDSSLDHLKKTKVDNTKNEKMENTPAKIGKSVRFGKIRTLVFSKDSAVDRLKYPIMSRIQKPKRGVKSILRAALNNPSTPLDLSAPYKDLRNKFYMKERPSSNTVTNAPDSIALGNMKGTPKKVYNDELKTAHQLNYPVPYQRNIPMEFEKSQCSKIKKNDLTGTAETNTKDQNKPNSSLVSCPQLNNPAASQYTIPMKMDDIPSCSNVGRNYPVGIYSTNVTNNNILNYQNGNYQDCVARTGSTNTKGKNIPNSSQVSGPQLNNPAVSQYNIPSYSNVGRDYPVGISRSNVTNDTVINNYYERNYQDCIAATNKEGVSKKRFYETTLDKYYTNCPDKTGPRIGKEVPMPMPSRIPNIYQPRVLDYSTLSNKNYSSNTSRAPTSTSTCLQPGICIPKEKMVPTASQELSTLLSAFGAYANRPSTSTSSCLQPGIYIPKEKKVSTASQERSTLPSEFGAYASSTTCRQPGVCIPKEKMVPTASQELSTLLSAFGAYANRPSTSTSSCLQPGICIPKEKKVPTACQKRSTLPNEFGAYASSTTCRQPGICIPKEKKVPTAFQERSTSLSESGAYASKTSPSTSTCLLPGFCIPEKIKVPTASQELSTLPSEFGAYTSRRSTSTTTCVQPGICIPKEKKVPTASQERSTLLSESGTYPSKTSPSTSTCLLPGFCIPEKKKVPTASQELSTFLSAFGAYANRPSTRTSSCLQPGIYIPKEKKVPTAFQKRSTLPSKFGAYATSTTTCVQPGICIPKEKTVPTASQERSTLLSESGAYPGKTSPSTSICLLPGFCIPEKKKVPTASHELSTLPSAFGAYANRAPTSTSSCHQPGICISKEKKVSTASQERSTFPSEFEAYATSTTTCVQPGICIPKEKKVPTASQERSTLLSESGTYASKISTSTLTCLLLGFCIPEKKKVPTASQELSTLLNEFGAYANRPSTSTSSCLQTGICIPKEKKVSTAPQKRSTLLSESGAYASKSPRTSTRLQPGICIPKEKKVSTASQKRSTLLSESGAHACTKSSTRLQPGFCIPTEKNVPTASQERSTSLSKSGAYPSKTSPSTSTCLLPGFCIPEKKMVPTASQERSTLLSESGASQAPARPSTCLQPGFRIPKKKKVPTASQERNTSRSESGASTSTSTCLQPGFRIPKKKNVPTASHEFSTLLREFGAYANNSPKSNLHKLPLKKRGIAWHEVLSQKEEISYPATPMISIAEVLDEQEKYAKSRVT